MSDEGIIADQLEQVLEALGRIPRRLQAIEKPDDFVNSPEGEDRLDAICMILVAVGQEPVDQTMTLRSSICCPRN